MRDSQIRFAILKNVRCSARHQQTNSPRSPRKSFGALDEHFDLAQPAGKNGVSC
jgi:hypothetical protein